MPFFRFWSSSAPAISPLLKEVEELRRKGLQRQAGSDLYRFVDPGQLSARRKRVEGGRPPRRSPTSPEALSWKFRSVYVEFRAGMVDGCSVFQDVPHHSPSPLLASPRREEDPPLSGRSGQMTSSLVNGRWRRGARSPRSSLPPLLRLREPAASLQAPPPLPPASGTARGSSCPPARPPTPPSSAQDYLFVEWKEVRRV